MNYQLFRETFERELQARNLFTTDRSGRNVYFGSSPNKLDDRRLSYYIESADTLETFGARRNRSMNVNYTITIKQTQANKYTMEDELMNLMFSVQRLIKDKFRVRRLNGFSMDYDSDLEHARIDNSIDIVI